MATGGDFRGAGQTSWGNAVLHVVSICPPNTHGVWLDSGKKSFSSSYSLPKILSLFLQASFPPPSPPLDQKTNAHFQSKILHSAMLHQVHSIHTPAQCACTTSTLHAPTCCITASPALLQPAGIYYDCKFLGSCRQWDKPKHSPKKPPSFPCKTISSFLPPLFSLTGWTQSLQVLWGTSSRWLFFTYLSGNINLPSGCSSNKWQE